MNWGLTKRKNESNLVDSFRDEFDHFFDNFFSNVPSSLLDTTWSPSIDVEENETEIKVTAEIPGIEEKNLNVSLNDHFLTISGEKTETNNESKNGQILISERKFGSFSRSVNIPEGIKTDQIKANYKNGTLVVTLPKDEKIKPRKISIDVK